LRDIQRQSGCAILFVTHDFGVVGQLCDRVIVMYAGSIVETAPVDVLFSNPAHPYTKALIASVPRIAGVGDRLPSIAGQPPPLNDLPPGCPFAPRCPEADDGCRNPPPVRNVGEVPRGFLYRRQQQQVKAVGTIRHAAGRLHDGADGAANPGAGAP
jgi:oligopeptide/dipeptide ABC transporter ATP-binding protein